MTPGQPEAGKFALYDCRLRQPTANYKEYRGTEIQLPGYP